MPIQTIFYLHSHLQEEMWNEIGFHKPLVGFWYRVILTIIGIFFPIYIRKFN